MSVALATGPARAATARILFRLAELESRAMSLARGPAKILTGDIFEQSTVQLAAPATLTRRRRPHAAHPEDSGWLQQSLRLLRDSVRSRTQPQPAARRRGVEEVRGLVAAGAKEIVLSGINLGSYGRDLTPRARTCRAGAANPGGNRARALRFSSIEPQDVTEDFVSLVASSDRLAPHFHVPLQSGSDRILRAMHRWYRARALCRADRADPPVAARRGDRRGRDRRLSGRDRRGFRRDRAIHRAPAVHLPARVLVFRAAGNEGGSDWRNAVPPETIRERARELRALSAAEERGVPRVAGGQRAARADAGALAARTGPKR